MSPRACNAGLRPTVTPAILRRAVRARSALRASYWAITLPTDVPVPDMSASRWELLAPIGEGAMGEVWRGRNRTLGQLVAVKILKASASSHPDVIARFEREARIAARLRSPHIAHVEDIGALADGRPFMVMELLDGVALSEYIRAARFSPAALAVEVARQVGAACDTAHAVGIVHRDIKPENCFVCSSADGRVHIKVLDFGVAKVTDSLLVTAHGVRTAENSLLGTPMYMSPEQARGDAMIDGRSDLFSLGVILYEILAGRLPYAARNLTQMLFAVLAGEIPPPSRFNPRLGAGIDAFFATALDRSAAQRFSSGAALAAALESALRESRGVGLDDSANPRPAPASGGSLPSARVPPTEPMALVDPTRVPIAPISPPVDGAMRAVRVPASHDLAATTSVARPAVAPWVFFALGSLGIVLLGGILYVALERGAPHRQSPAGPTARAAASQPPAIPTPAAPAASARTVARPQPSTPPPAAPVSAVPNDAHAAPSGSRITPPSLPTRADARATVRPQPRGGRAPRPGSGDVPRGQGSSALPTEL